MTRGPIRTLFRCTGADRSRSNWTTRRVSQSPELISDFTWPRPNRTSTTSARLTTASSLRIRTASPLSGGIQTSRTPIAIPSCSTAVGSFNPANVTRTESTLLRVVLPSGASGPDTSSHPACLPAASMSCCKAFKAKKRTAWTGSVSFPTSMGAFPQKYSQARRTL